MPQDRVKLMGGVDNLGRLAMRAVRPIDAEAAHGLTISLLARLPVAAPGPADPRLAVTVAGLAFAHPVGLAAGFDKDARAAHAMGRFGFAAAEVGTLTPLPQSGNARPRLFRLAEDEAVINRMGFNNDGQAAAAVRLARLRDRTDRPLIGVNIGANKDAADRIADYAQGVRAMAHLGDWLTVNISSPNTPGLRALQDEGALDALLGAVAAARAEVAATPPGSAAAAGSRPAGPPIFLKVAPDLDREQVGGMVRAAMTHGIDAIIIGNTTISRPSLASRHAGETGGLSGAPLKALAMDRLRDFRAATGGQLPLIAAGGIASADDAWDRLAAGASLVQLYSALVYEGPWLARSIVTGLVRRLDRSSFASIADVTASAG
jgi:dihydroorotate dehydrogenase